MPQSERGGKFESPVATSNPDSSGLAALDGVPTVELGHYPTPVDELVRLRAKLGASQTLLIKRDDAIPFGFGGNKVRKLQFVAAEALAAGADTLITTGGVQSNHARATAAAAVRLGLRCVLVLNGQRPVRATGNLLIDEMLGAAIEFVDSREARTAAMESVAERLRREGRRPFIIPLGASTATGALGLVSAVGELVRQGCVPDIIVHCTSSGGTQAGLVAGCSLWGLDTRVLGVSADGSVDAVRSEVGAIVADVGRRLQPTRPLPDPSALLIDASQVGDGYGIPTTASREATELLARTEGIFLDPTYTAKAMAGLLAARRAGDFGSNDTVLFWHTGGTPSLFAS